MNAAATPDVIEAFRLGHVNVRVTRVGHGTSHRRFVFAFAAIPEDLEQAVTFEGDELNDLVRAADLARRMLSVLESGRGVMSLAAALGEADLEVQP
ncbi:MAG: hypothetical protein KDA25_05900 [Phycisphaerales bacterium]|nr:hypothetical protein [Phycisphaerales bacterium]